MKLGHFEIPSTDPKQTADFYCKRLGFIIETVQAGNFFWLTRDGMSFLVRPKGSNADIHNIVLYSSIPDKDAQAVKDAGIKVAFGADNCHHFKDPNGYPLQIVDPGEDHSG